MRRREDREVIDPTIMSIVGAALAGGAAFGGVKGRTELPGYVNKYMNGDIRIDEMVTHTMGLEDINSAFDLMHDGESNRSVVIF